MNWHLVSFFVDVVGWIVIALFISHLYITTEKGKHNRSIYPSSAFTSLLAGFWSLANNGLPDIGLSFISFFYVLIACIGVIFYYSAKKEMRHIHIHMVHAKHLKKLHNYKRR